MKKSPNQEIESAENIIYNIGGVGNVGRIFANFDFAPFDLCYIEWRILVFYFISTSDALGVLKATIILPKSCFGKSVESKEVRQFSTHITPPRWGVMWVVMG